MTVPITYDLENEFIMRVGAGEDPAFIKRDMGIAARDFRALMAHESVMQAQRDFTSLIQLKTRHIVEHNSEELITRAVKSLLDGLPDDPKLALQLLEKTGALRSVGMTAGMEVANVATGSEGGNQIVINVAPPGSVTGDNTKDAVVIKTESND